MTTEDALSDKILVIFIGLGVPLIKRDFKQRTFKSTKLTSPTFRMLERQV